MATKADGVVFSGASESVLEGGMIVISMISSSILPQSRMGLCGSALVRTTICAMIMSNMLPLNSECF